jgi:hypothetical protein
VRLTLSLINADSKRLLGLLIEDVRFTRDFSVNSNTSLQATIPIPVQSNSLLDKNLPILTFICSGIGENVSFEPYILITITIQTLIGLNFVIALLIFEGNYFSVHLVMN